MAVGAGRKTCLIAALAAALGLRPAPEARGDGPPPAPAPPAPPTAPAPAPAGPGDPDVRELLRRLRSVEERLDKVTKEKEDLSRQVEDLSKRVGDPGGDRGGEPGRGRGLRDLDYDPTPWEIDRGAPFEPHVTGRGELPGLAGDANASVGGGVSRKGYAQEEGNRGIRRLRIRASYNYPRYGLQFATEDDELSLKVDAMAQADARLYEPAGAAPTSSGYYVPRTRIYFSGRLSRPIAYHLSFQDSYGQTLGVLNAFLDFHYSDKVQFRFGRFKTPYTYEFYKIPVYELLAPERSVYNVNFQGNRQVGMQAWGELFDKRVEYAVGPFDGPRNSYQDFNSTPDLFAFVNAIPFLSSDSPLRNLNLGGSLDWGVQGNPVSPAALRTNQQPYPDNASAATPEGTGSLPFLNFNNGVKERGARELWELHMAYYYKGLSLLGAWDAGSQSYATKGDRPVAVPVGGYFVQAAYLITGETVNDIALIDPIRPFDLRPGHAGWGAFQPSARYSEVDLGKQVFTAGFADPNQWTNHVRMTDVGFNWYLNRWVKLYFDWEHAMFGRPIYLAPGRTQKDSDLFWFRFQYYF